MPATSITTTAKSRRCLLTTDEAATILGVTPRTLEVWRCTKRHQIPFLKVGRLIRYRRDDLDRWLASRLVDASE